MQHHGGLTPTQAREAALERYPYETDDTPFHGLAFHVEAWHWAMPAPHGNRYVVELPELTHPSPEYRAIE
ncbi:hypothetical protein [Streptomyces sp. JH34]|uniref:hypothetical protein n=1 Tax=Streptomyces sp. JH34 TaxID=2793633 RepID=UPI0023F8749D|nr:hypothetical protein [Streptomyces sp. JH34]MDF6023033.1 hypothetical protein [Streptomyces sp. JH34]